MIYILFIIDAIIFLSPSLTLSSTPLHSDSEHFENPDINTPLSHELGSEQTNERMSAAERASEASSAEQANE